MCVCIWMYCISDRYLYLCLCPYHSVPIFMPLSIHSDIDMWHHVTVFFFPSMHAGVLHAQCHQGVLEFICDMADYAFFGRAAEMARSVEGWYPTTITSREYTTKIKKPIISHRLYIPYIGTFIIPTDSIIFQRGRSTTNQMISHDCSFNWSPKAHFIWLGSTFNIHCQFLRFDIPVQRKGTGQCLPENGQEDASG